MNSTYRISAHQDFITGRWWWVVVGRLNGLDATYSEPRYKSENRARHAARRYIERWK
jgi:hypothetical protein